MRKRPYTLRFHTNEYDYIGNHPKELTHNWAENAQGVTHDEENWYISNDKTIVKYHITTDINSNNTLKRIGMPGHLKSLCYEKFKALTHYKGFLFVPLDAPDSDQPAAIAMFRASDLSYVYHVELNPEWELGTPGWVAIHPKEGRLYTSSNKLNYQRGLTVFDFAINDDESGFTIEFSHELFPRLKMMMAHMQGGVFSPEGQLYLINGYYNTDVSKGGISVFSMHDFHFRQKSSQRGKFRFQWDTSWDVAEEPEGITFWDLDEDDRAPHVKGQLHAILLDNDAIRDDVYMKHYRMSDPKPESIPEFYMRHAHLKDEALNAATFPNQSLRGITHNHKAQFIATADALHTMPLLMNNPDNLATFHRNWPDALQEYDHIGDITYYDEFVLVPFSKDDATAVATFNAANLELNAIEELPFDDRIAFVGINPLTREQLYAVTVNGSIRRYDIELSTGNFNLIPSGDNFLIDDSRAPAPVVNVTGGEVSAVSGFIYIVHDGNISVFHSDGSFVDASAIAYNLGEASFDTPDQLSTPKFLTTDHWHEPFPPGTDFENIADVSAIALNPGSGSALIRSWEISTIMLIGNKRSKEFHLKGCPFQRRMALKNYVPFKTVERALENNYNGCFYCMRLYDES